MPITRRVLLQALSTALFFPSSSAFCAAEPLTFSVGKIPAPGDINRIVSAGTPADLWLLATAPDNMVGFSSFDLSRKGEGLVPDRLRFLPKYGRLTGRGSSLSLEKLLALKPDLIVDYGNANGTWMSEAQRIHDQTRIPWLLINGELKSTPQQLLTTGEILGTTGLTHQQADLARRFIDDALAFSRTAAANVSFYAARGARGLETGLKGAIHTEAAELLGLRNVAEVPGRNGLTQVSMENLLAWQPDIILTQDAVTFDAILSDPAWRGVKAVADRRVLLLSGLPFGWLDAPPGVNRVLGMRRLHAWLDPAVNAGFRQDMTRYAGLFWHAPLSEERYQRLVSAI